MGVNSFREAKQRLVDLVKFTKTEYRYNASSGYQGINDKLAKRLGIIVEEHKMNFDFGLYIPADTSTRPNPVIWLDPTAGDNERLNFSYYHEISHHLIRTDNDLYSFLSDLASQNEDFDSLVDRFANIGAAEFLIPSEEIYTIQQERGFTIQLLPDLDYRYPASKPAIAIQLAQCASHKCFIVVCQFGLLPNQNREQERLLNEVINSKPKLFVQYASSSPSQDRYSIGKHALIPENHILYRAFQNQGYLKGNDLIPFKNGTKWAEACEALFYKGKVYGAFNLSSPAIPTNLQPRLF
jgi:Zn-dependent peptidase ImmA (M78 family)